MLLATRHKRTYLALTPASKAGTQFTYPGGMEGWVHLGDLIMPRTGIEPMTTWSKVRCPDCRAAKTADSLLVWLHVNNVWLMGRWSSMCMCVFCDTGLIATVDEGSDSLSNHRCLMVSRTDGTCRSFMSADQALFVGKSVCLDPVYDNLWRSESHALYITLYSSAASHCTPHRSVLLCVCFIKSPIRYPAMVK